VTQPEPYTYTDPSGDKLIVGFIRMVTDEGAIDSVAIHAVNEPDSSTVYVPLADVEQVVTAIRAAAGQPAPVSPPTAALRDRAAEALYQHSHPGWATSYADLGQDEQDTYRERAEAVLAVFPAPVDRVAVLREAADVLDTLPADVTSFDAAEHKYKGGAAAEKLRRMADEAQQAPATTTDAALAAAIPDWEAVYEPGNVSDYLIGYANTEAAAKGAAIAWVLSQSDKDTNRLEWVEEGGDSRDHDHWDDLIERHDDGIDTGVGVTVRRRLYPYTAADFAPADEAQQNETEALCGKTIGVSGLYYRPCTRPAGHPEAYCRDDTGNHLFLAPDTTETSR
jgi:hypothetical protein